MAREKAKDPAELSVDVKLKNLFQLQTIHSKIDSKRTQRGELPLEVKDLEDEIEGLTIRVGRMLSQTEELTREIASRRATIEKNNMDIARYQEQIKNVRNNREYDSLTKEIEYAQLDNQLNDKKIREAQSNQENLQDQIRKSNELLSERRADLDLKKSELDEIIEENRIEEAELDKKASELELTVDSRLLSAYKRIKKNARNGLGIVCVQRDACGGCFNKIPPQRQLDVRMHKKIIVCEYCGRILIDPELAGIKTDKPEDSKSDKKSAKKGGRRSSSKEE